MSSTEDKLVRMLEDYNYSQALELYEYNKKKEFTTNLYFLIAKAYHIENQYDKALTILQKCKFSKIGLKYEVKVLQFKARYLADKRCEQVLQQLKSMVKQDEDSFKDKHKRELEEFKSVLNNKFSENRSKQQLKLQFENYKKIKKQQEQSNSIAFQGFPVFLVSKRWFNQWKAYVGYTSSFEGPSINRTNPGFISQFELLDHFYNTLYDPQPKKYYTNQYLFHTNQYQLITKRCWQFLKGRYGGLAISRVNIANTDKLNQTLTEVELKRLVVFRSNKKDQKFYVQVSRRESWKRVNQKLIRIWGQGRIWKWEKSGLSKLNENKSIQEENTSSDMGIMFEQIESPKKGPVSQILDWKCANCGKSESLKYCECKTVKYCDIECLKSHRSNHKKDCDSKKELETQMTQIVFKYNFDEEKRYGGRKGIVGLRNLGNTCFMNSGIQCLSNTKEITDYFMSNKFLNDLNRQNPLGSNGALACSYARLLRDLWTGGEDDVSPAELKKAISKFAPQFSGYSQHDSQELISTLLDGLHEDTNLVKVKPSTTIDEEQRQDTVASKMSEENYAKRNQSMISSLTVGQFKSKLVCPKCNKVSIIFDPYMLISLPIPQNMQLNIFLVGKKLDESAQKVLISFSTSETIQIIVDKLANEFELNPKHLKFLTLSPDYDILVEHKGSDPAQNLYKDKRENTIFCYEIPQDIDVKVYTIKYCVLERKKLEMIGYPRFFILNKKIQQKKIEEIVDEEIHNAFLKYVSEDRRRRQVFDFQINFEKYQIQVVLKTNKVKVATYRESRKDITQNESVNLSQCLDLFIKQEKLDKQNYWYCNRCQAHVEATKQMEIYKTNKILLLGLKRFRYGSKIKTKIIFPIKDLNLTNYVLSNKESRKPIFYQLYAVSNHYGSMSGGHYTAYCKNFINNNWYEFNDSRVSKITEEQVVSSNAYVLFYKRID